MAIVVGLDVHRVQITYDALNTATGEVVTGRIAPALAGELTAVAERWSETLRETPAGAHPTT